MSAFPLESTLVAKMIVLISSGHLLHGAFVRMYVWISLVVSSSTIYLTTLRQVSINFSIAIYYLRCDDSLSLTDSSGTTKTNDLNQIKQYRKRNSTKREDVGRGLHLVQIYISTLFIWRWASSPATSQTCRCFQLNRTIGCYIFVGLFSC